MLIAVGTDAVKLVDQAFDEKIDPRAALPTYKDHAYAVLIYRNQNEKGREYVPLIDWQQRPITSVTLNIDENGRRIHKAGRDSDVPSAEAISFFVGSAMFGTGADDDSTIPAWFDVLTTEARVTNYAQTGYTSRQSFALLMNLVGAGEAP